MQKKNLLNCNVYFYSSSYCKRETDFRKEILIIKKGGEPLKLEV